MKIILSIMAIIAGITAPAYAAAAENRSLPLAGAYNVRDLGGYPAADGRKVAWGLVYRSGDLHSLTEADKKLLEARNIKTIVDFRMPEEIAKAPHARLATVTRTVALPIEYGNILNLENAKTSTPEMMMMDLNRSLATEAHEEYRAFFRLLEEPENAPLLFNCSCGKDRAGFAAALFLASLGVDRETILDDFMLSADGVREKYADIVAAKPALAPILTVKREYLEAAFETIDTRYGGLDPYLRETLGVDIALMRSLYTVSADEERLGELASQAAIYGYPLLLMDATRQTLTAPGKGAANTFNHMREFPDHTFTDIVTANVDTLYSVAWLDLRHSPVELSPPEMGERYYVMQLMDGWTNVFSSIGSRTTGNRLGSFLITGPGWKGTVPPGLTEVKAPTNMVWILGRTQTNGKRDYAAVQAIQDKYRLKALNPGAKAQAGRQLSLPPMEEVEQMEAGKFFSLLNMLMLDNPPSEADRPVLEAISELGIAPGKAFVLEDLPEPKRRAVERGFAAALRQLAELSPARFGAVSGGWAAMPDNIGNYGVDYLFRAFIARKAIGANLKEDAVYPTTSIDAEGKPLSGKNSYTLKFGQKPPVRAFWSVTVYDENQRLTANPIGRYALGDRDALTPDADGGVTLYLQHADPGQDKRNNWLPVPAEDFNLVLRLYWPEQAILDGSWPMPKLSKIIEPY